VSTAVDPYRAYTEESEYFEVAWPDVHEVMPQPTGELLAATGRLLAYTAYRELAELGTDRLDRTQPTGRVLIAELPESCDTKSLEFRRSVARCFDDLAADIESGLAPLPRCGAEAWALHVMIERAPHLLAATDEELRQLGVQVPTDEYQPPNWEALYEFITPDAASSIAEARTAYSDDEDAPETEEPEGGWGTPELWISTYGFTEPRNPERGHRNEPIGGLKPDRVRVLIGLEIPDDVWSAVREGYGATMLRESLAEVLTPQAATVLWLCAGRLLGTAVHELSFLGGKTFDRAAYENDPWVEESFFGQLPAICDRQGAAWRLQMVRAIDDLACDLAAGRAPIPRTTGEEIVFHLILRSIEAMLDEMEMWDEDEIAVDDSWPRIPRRAELSPRHLRANDLVEAFTVDDDVLNLYARPLDGIEDPEDPTNQFMHMGDLRPTAWHDPDFFRFVVPRDPDRLLDPGIAASLRHGSEEFRALIPDPDAEPK